MAALGKTKRKAGFIPLTIIFILFIVFYMVLPPPSRFCPFRVRRVA